MKKRILILITALTLVFSGCSTSKSSDKANETTNKALLSSGVQKVAQKIVDDYDSYLNGDITKDAFHDKVKKYDEQIGEIYDSDNLNDSLFTTYPYELTRMLESDIADKDIYDLCINDMKTLLSGKEIEFADKGWKEHEFRGVTFRLPEAYESDGDTSNDSAVYTCDEMNYVQITVLNNVDYFTIDSFESFVDTMNKTDGVNLSLDTSTYISRNCDFYYTSDGTMTVTDVDFNAKLFVCTDSNKLVAFYFYSPLNLDDKTIETILNDAYF